MNVEPGQYKNGIDRALEYQAREYLRFDTTVEHTHQLYDADKDIYLLELSMIWQDPNRGPQCIEDALEYFCCNKRLDPEACAKRAANEWHRWIVCHCKARVNITEMKPAE